MTEHHAARSMVAPLAGAWIEIRCTSRSSDPAESLPSRERGLKFLCVGFRKAADDVAPLAGAWIEIGRID